jgi:hypothetical protein
VTSTLSKCPAAALSFLLARPRFLFKHVDTPTFAPLTRVVKRSPLTRLRRGDETVLLASIGATLVWH